MNKDAEIEDFPLGCVVRTPTGSIGVVVKHRYASKIDLFARVDVQFSNNPRDGVVLQPKYLVLLEMPPPDYRPPLEFQTASARARVVQAVKEVKGKTHDCHAPVAPKRTQPEQSLPLAGSACQGQGLQASLFCADESGASQDRLGWTDTCLDDVLSAGQTQAG